jgi:hypothetical protein
MTKDRQKLIEFNVAEDISRELIPAMPDWQSLTNKIKVNPVFANNVVLNISNTTVELRLEFANMHLTFLRQAYKKDSSNAINFIKRAMMENIIINLVSTLDALAFVINEIYDFRVGYKYVQIDHQTPKHERKGNCVRCRLDASKDAFSNYVSTEFPKRPIRSDHWYNSISEYRNQILHRTLYLINFRENGGSYLPDDPAILNLKGRKIYYDKESNKVVIQNYTLNREVREFSQFLFDKVFSIVQVVYRYLLIKME